MSRPHGTTLFNCADSIRRPLRADSLEFFRIVFLRPLLTPQSSFPWSNRSSMHRSPFTDSSPLLPSFLPHRLASSSSSFLFAPLNYEKYVLETSSSGSKRLPFAKERRKSIGRNQKVGRFYWQIENIAKRALRQKSTE